MWVHRFLSCRDLLRIPTLTGSVALRGVRRSAGDFGDTADFLPEYEMPFPGWVPSPREAAERRGGAQDVSLPHGQGDAGEGLGKHADVWQSRT